MSCPYSGNAEILRVCGAVTLRAQLAEAQKTIDDFAKESLRDQEKLRKIDETWSRERQRYRVNVEAVSDLLAEAKSKLKRVGYLGMDMEIATLEHKLANVEKRAQALENLDICVDRERMVSIRRDGDELVVGVLWKGHGWEGRVDLEGNPKNEPGKE